MKQLNFTRFFFLCIVLLGTFASSHAQVTMGGVNLGNLPKYHMVFTDGSVDANWQGATKGFAGNMAVNGLTASLRTSGSFGYAGTIYTNASTLGVWQSIVNNNAGQAYASLNQTSILSGLQTDLENVFTQVNALTATTGYTNVSSTSLDGLNTQNGIAETYVINITSGLQVSSQIKITGDANDFFILRWDTDANPANGYTGQVKFQSGGAIIPLGGLVATNFINVAGDINSSGGGSNPPAPYPQGPRTNNGTGALITNGSDFSGGGFFTGYWFTTGDPSLFPTGKQAYGQTASLSNGIFVGGWYSKTNKFSMTSGTSGVYVPPPCIASLGDFVFIDKNANGIQDQGELPLANVTVSLFQDANADGIPDGASIGTDVTDAAGLYLFTDLCPGNYIVQFGAVPGYDRTIQINTAGKDAGDSDADPVTGYTGTIPIASGENDLSNDAGYVCIAPAAPTVAITQPTCTIATGTITVTAPLGTGLTYSINGTTYQAGTNFSGLAAGSYNVTVKNANGCISTVTTAVINPQPPTPAAPTVTITQPTCAIATGTITVTAPLGTGLTYSINGTTYQPGTTFSGLAAGSYNVTVKNANGCISTVTTAVINPQPPTPAAPTVTITQPTCAIATGTITVTAPLGTGLTYSINGTIYQAGTTFSGLAAGSYNVTVKNANGCISGVTTAVINPQPPTPVAPTVTITQPTCTVATGTITVTAPLGTGLTYSINGTTYQAGTTFSGLAAGSYNVTVMNANGCISTVTTAGIDPQPLTPAALTVTITQPTCTIPTGTITITAPLGTGLTYSIDGATYQAGTTFSGLEAGSYNVTVKNANGCISTVTTAVIDPQPPTPAAPRVTITQPTCTVATGTITVTAPLGTGLTYSINGTNYQAGTTFSGLAAGTYYVRVMNDDGCISGVTTAVIDPQPPAPAAPTVTITQPTCTVATGMITVTAPLGTGLTYSINGITYQAGTTFSSLAAGSYNVTVTNASGCISTLTTAVIDPQPSTPAAPTVTITQPTCIVPTGTITVTAPLGTGFTYSIDGTTFQPGTTFSSLAAGSYNVTVKNANGCISTVTTAVINPPPAAPAAPTVTITQPTCTAKGTIRVTAPLGTGFTYSINGTTYQAGTTFSNLAVGTYYVTAKNPNGCISGVTTAVINPQPPTPAVPTVTITQPTCTVATGTITVTAPLGTGLTYSINGTTYQAGTTFSGLAAGTYYVRVKNPNGCISGFRTAVINPQPITPVAPTLTITHPLCPGAKGTITVTAPLGTGLTYSINGTTYQAGTTFSGLAAGSYNVTVKNANGCISAVTTAVINVGPPDTTPPMISCSFILPDFRNVSTQSDNCTPTGSLIITQTPAAGTVVSGAGTTIVTVTVTDASGNSSSSSFTLTKTCSSTTSARTTKINQQPVVNQTAETDLEISLTPNPSSNSFVLMVKSTSNETIMVRVLDNYGRMVNLLKAISHQVLKFGSDLKRGVYFIEVIQGDNKKVVKGLKM